MLPAMFGLSALAVNAIGVALAVATVGGVIVHHDYKVRAAVEAKWKPKLEKCVGDNTALEGEYKQFVAWHNHMLEDQAKRSKDAKDRKDKALAELAKVEKGEQVKIDAARAVANGPALPKEESCAKAVERMRALRLDLMRDDAGNH